MTMLPDYREIELTLNRQNVVDQIAALLYSLNIVKDDEHVIDISYETVPMTIKIKKHQEIVVING